MAHDHMSSHGVGPYFPKFKGSRVGTITKAGHKLTKWNKKIYIFLSKLWNRPSIPSLTISLFCNNNVLFSGTIVFTIKGRKKKIFRSP